MNQNPTNAVALRQFLGLNPWLLDDLKANKPKVTGTTMEESALTGRESQGWEKCMERIEELARDPMPSTDDAGHLPQET
jgi:hypothetical protein